MNATKTINVWLDRTSDYDDPKWVVSLDDADGSDTLSVHDGKEEALAAGRREAAKRGVEMTHE